VAYRFFSPFPKHLQIRELLLRRIAREFQPGDQFPTEQALAGEFGVTRKTVREALRWIEAEGLIRRGRGQGTFVTARPERPADSRVTGMSEHFAQLNLDTSTEVVSKGVETPPPEIAAALHRPDGEPVFRVTRTRHFEGAPLVYNECFVILHYGGRALACDFDQPSLMKELEEAVGESFQEKHQQIEATVADTHLAGLLDIALGAPVLVITRHYVDARGQSALVFRSSYRADRYYYTIDLAHPPDENAAAPKRGRAPARARKAG
jgi:GntR family transcriptional regulator